MEHHEKSIYVAKEGFGEGLRQKLEADFGIDRLDIEDVFTSSQLSKIELRKEYIYVALQFPEFDRVTRTFLGKELHIFLNQRHLFLINKHDLKHARIFHETKEALLPKQELRHPFNLFYELLDYCVTHEYRVLRKFREEIEEITADIFDQSTRRDQILIIQEIKRNLINFTSLMEPLGEVLTDLQTRYHSFIDDRGIEKLDDSLDKIKKMLNNLQNFQEQINIVSETNEAIMVRSTDRSVRILTLINIVLLVPTIITSFFGMNVYFGWSERSPWPVFVIILAILLVTIGSLLFLRRTQFFK
jgi:magnesium transporter